ATVLFGASISGVAQAVENLLRGVLDGLADSDSRERFRRLVLCETDRARYDEARRTVRRLAMSGFFGAVDVSFDEEEIPPPPSPAMLVRGGPAPRGLAYLFARAERTEDRLTFNLSLLAPAGGAALQARPQDVDLPDLDKLLASIDSNSFDVDA